MASGLSMSSLAKEQIMNKTQAIKSPRGVVKRAAPVPSSLDAARIAYVSSPNRISLGGLLKKFAGSGRDFEVCGELPTSK